MSFKAALGLLILLPVLILWMDIRFCLKAEAGTGRNAAAEVSLNLFGARREWSSGLKRTDNKPSWFRRLGGKKGKAFMTRLAFALAGEFVKPSLPARWFNALIRIDRLRWHTEVGLNDPMTTALAAGGLWSFKGLVLACLSSRFILAPPDIMVIPSFDEKVVASHLEVGAVFKVLNLLLAVLIVTRAALRIGLLRGGGILEA